MSFWQTKNWWEMLVKSKQAEKVIYLWDLLIEKRSIWLWKYWLFVLGLDENMKMDFEDELIKLCKQEKCLFVQIETINRIQNAEYRMQKLKLTDDWQLIIHSSFKLWYYKKFITPYTAIIDLSKSEDEILAEMKPKWRYNIRLAEKKEIIVKEVEKTDENIKMFYDLMLETTSRDRFSGNTLDYYKIFLETIENSSLLIAYNDNFPIAAWIFVFEWKVSIYYYWASTNDDRYRNLMAPYLLQWTAIKKAKKIWSDYYDFLWITTPWDEKSSLSWVTDFKMKFTKDIIYISDSYIWINNIIIFKVLQFIRYIKNKLKK